MALLVYLKLNKMKNLFFSLLVVGVAFAGSAFTTQKAIGDHYVQNPDGTYRLISGAINPEFCESSTKTCAFVQTTSETLAPSLTATEAAALKTSGKLAEVVNPITSLPYTGIYND